MSAAGIYISAGLAVVGGVVCIAKIVVSQFVEDAAVELGISAVQSKVSGHGIIGRECDARLYVSDVIERLFDVVTDLIRGPVRVTLP